MMRRFWRKPETPTTPDSVAKERRLEDAEQRVEALEHRARWLRVVVVERDAKNHWQESVNALFLGGQP
jgi:hypothetical protein